MPITYRSRSLQSASDPKSLDPIIRVDRSLSSPYPDFVVDFKHPELQNSGPPEYDIAGVEQWCPVGENGQMRGIRGEEAYAHFRDMGDLPNHFKLSDLEAIRAKGPLFFERCFGNRCVVALASLALSRHGGLYVPYAFNHPDQGCVEVSWFAIKRFTCDSDHPFLRHPRKSSITL